MSEIYDWFDRQYQDVKGNLKTSLLLAVLGGMTTAFHFLVSGMPLWRHALIDLLFSILAMWLAIVLWENRPERMAAQKSQSNITAPSRLKIISATYGAEGINEGDVTDHLLERLHGNAFAEPIVADLFRGFDPASGKPKRLRVRYSFDGQEATITRPEYALLVLPEDPYLKKLDGLLDQLQIDALRYIKDLKEFVEKELETYPKHGDLARLPREEVQSITDAKRAWLTRVESAYDLRFANREKELILRFGEKGVQVRDIASKPGYRFIQDRIMESIAAIVSATHEIDGIHVGLKVQ